MQTFTELVRSLTSGARSDVDKVFIKEFFKFLNLKFRLELFIVGLLLKI